MKSIFDKKACNEIFDRLDKLSIESPAEWGEMNVTQMLKHCQKPIKLAFGEESVKKPNFIMKILIKFMKPTLYNDKPWKKSLPTAKEFVIRDDKGFEIEKQNLKELITRMTENEDYFKPSQEHPIFGELKDWMWGQSGYKHLDHHLKQFGV